MSKTMTLKNFKDHAELHGIPMYPEATETTIVVPVNGSDYVRAARWKIETISDGPDELSVDSYETGAGWVEIICVELGDDPFAEAFDTAAWVCSRALDTVL